MSIFGDIIFCTDIERLLPGSGQKGSVSKAGDFKYIVSILNLYLQSIYFDRLLIMNNKIPVLLVVKGVSFKDIISFTG